MTLDERINSAITAIEIMLKAKNSDMSKVFLTKMVGLLRDIKLACGDKLQTTSGQVSYMQELLGGLNER